LSPSADTDRNSFDTFINPEATMPKSFAFILTHEFTLTPLSLFVDTLRLAGDEADRSRRIAFDWQIIGTRGLPVRSSCGIDVLPTAEPANLDSFDYIVVVGGLLHNAKALTDGQIHLLKQAAAAGKPIVGLCTASFVLAQHGFLDGHQACVSWLHLEEFQATHPGVDARADKLFLIDRGRITCAGGVGAADLAAALVAGALDEVAANKAADILLLDRVRTHRDLQPNKNLFGKVANRTVRQALLAMQNHCVEPLPVHEIATKANCSPRQLERLFLAHLSITPRHAYMAIRIERAKALIVKNQLSLAEIAYQTGFMNPSHFAKAFKKHAGMQPSRYGHCSATSQACEAALPEAESGSSHWH
jgi:transcriptional regulator GlxA family with amidase domain